MFLLELIDNNLGKKTNSWGFVFIYSNSGKNGKQCTMLDRFDITHNGRVEGEDDGSGWGGQIDSFDVRKYTD